jgi:hypothetical protein
MDVDFKKRKKEVYVPLKKTLDLIIKRVKDLDIHVPLSYIARMDLAGRFQDETTKPMRKYVYKYLGVANKYRSIYFEFLKKSKTIFDREMAKDGSFAPGVKQYDSLKNQLPEALLKTNGKVWVTSYDQYLPTIREHAEKHSSKPRIGQSMYKALKLKFKKDLTEIKRLQALTIKRSKLFQKELNLAINNPDLVWGEWSNKNK